MSRWERSSRFAGWRGWPGCSRWMRATRWIAMLAAAGIAVAAAPSAASAAPPPALKMIWGPVTLPNNNSAFPIYKKLGVQVFEIELLWNETAPSRPAQPTNPNDPGYQWPAYLDQVVSQAKQNGIKVCLMVQGSPGWANGGRVGAWAPTHPADYGKFLIAASHRYPSVHHWMIWGEPNRPLTFYPMPANSPVGPRRYASLLNVAYHSLKYASKKNIVIAGDTMSYGAVHPPDFIRWMRLPNGKPPPLDYYGHNPYSNRFPRLSEPPYNPGVRDINDIDTLESQLSRTYHRTVKLWISEYSVSSDQPNRAFDFAVSRKEQARWATAAFQLVDSVNYVAGFGWYDLMDEPPTVPGHLTTGLMTWDVHPKLAFYSYENAR